MNKFIRSSVVSLFRATNNEIVPRRSMFTAEWFGNRLQYSQEPSKSQVKKISETFETKGVHYITMKNFHDILGGYKQNWPLVKNIALAKIQDKFSGEAVVQGCIKNYLLICYEKKDMESIEELVKILENEGLKMSNSNDLIYWTILYDNGKYDEVKEMICSKTDRVSLFRLLQIC